METRLQEMMNELKGLIMRIQRNESQLSRSKTKEQRESIEASRKFNHPWGSSTKLEFPRFDGERLDGWLLCCEYFFEIGKITPENRVKVAAIHMKERALQWH